MPKPTVIIQARMGSKRLPYKLMMPISMSQPAGDNVIYHTCRRALAIKGIEQLVVATTTHHSDNTLEQWADNNSLICCRGAEQDVLDRFYKTAYLYDADPIIRISANNPCIDSKLISAMLEKYYEAGADYLSNIRSHSFPQGMEAEIFSFAALEKAWEDISDSYTREQITPYFQESDRLKCVDYHEEGALPHAASIRVTLDTLEDRIVICAVYDLLGMNFGYRDVVELFNKYPWLRMINQNSLEICPVSPDEVTMLSNAWLEN